MLTKSDISQIRTVVQEELEIKLKPVNRRLKKLEQYGKDTLSFLDKQNIDLDKRTKRIEHHLGLPQIV